MKADISDLEKNEHLIGKKYVDQHGNSVRNVNGVAIKQIEETTPEKAALNRTINLWRMRNKK